jgi:hypothetical protein
MNDVGAQFDHQTDQPEQGDEVAARAHRTLHRNAVRCNSAGGAETIQLGSGRGDGVYVEALFGK